MPSPLERETGVATPSVGTTSPVVGSFRVTGCLPRRSGVCPVADTNPLIGRHTPPNALFRYGRRSWYGGRPSVLVEVVHRAVVVHVVRPAALVHLRLVAAETRGCGQVVAQLIEIDRVARGVLDRRAFHDRGERLAAAHLRDEPR